jgi:hypothetical protein
MAKPRTADAGRLLDAGQAVRGRAYDSSDRQVFDRLTRLVSVLLDVPVVLITVVDGDDLLFATR